LLARKAVFGNANENANYIFALYDELRLSDHSVRLSFATREQALNKLMLVVLAKEGQRIKTDCNRRLMGHDEARAYVTKWRRENSVFINRYFGTADKNRRFLLGIFFAPSTSNATNANLQDLVQADAAHLDFGKYTLYSAYGSTANAQAAPIAFAIQFGNEDTLSWTNFWEFALALHPWLNDRTMTIITDQDKGSKASIQAVIPQAFNFHCSFHRRLNINIHCKGGKKIHSASWMFNKLLSCRTTEEIGQTKMENYPYLKPSDITYLDNLSDEEQYPAARCAMGKEICMY
jgi:hypothetical protein